MPTLEHLGWIALGLALIVAVGAVIMVPIYEKAKDQKGEIEGFDFDVSKKTDDISKNHEIARLEVKDDNFREDILAANMAYNV